MAHQLGTSEPLNDNDEFATHDCKNCEHNNHSIHSNPYCNGCIKVGDTDFIIEYRKWELDLRPVGQ